MKPGYLPCLVLLLTAMVITPNPPGFFELTAIQANDAPAQVLSDIESTMHNTTNVVWRAIYQQDDHLIVVNTHDSLVAGNNWARWHVFGATDDGQWSLAELRSTALIEGREYGWSGGYSGPVVHASGWAFDIEAHRVVGTTSHGRISEALVVNGFWYLRLDDRAGEELFRTLIVEDAQGRAIHILPMPPS